MANKIMAIEKSHELHTPCHKVRTNEFLSNSLRSSLRKDGKALVV